MSMLLNFFNKVCARIKAGTIAKRGKIAALFSHPEPADPEHFPTTICNRTSEAFHAVNVVSLWRLLRGKIPVFSLFTFFPD
jgi:hypothetical protein